MPPAMPTARAPSALAIASFAANRAARDSAVRGAPEGVLAASALRCIGVQMQGRLTALSEDERKRHETDIQKLTDKTIGEVDAAASAKEKEILGK